MDEAVITRFWEKVDKTGDCWLWTAALFQQNGYGQAWDGERPTTAHRVAYRITYGDPPPDKPFVLHRCDVRACVRPTHLFAGSQADNIHDMDTKGRRRTVARRGEANAGARLTSAQVHEIRELYAAGGAKYRGVGRRAITHRTLAARFGVSHNSIGRIVKGLAWRHDG